MQAQHRHIIQLSAYGDAAVLQPAQQELQAPATGLVRIRQQAAGVNYVDVYHRSGRYALPLPGVPGVEGSGVIESLGAGVSGLEVGARVAWIGASGGYASHVDIDAARVISLPAEVSLEQAGAGMLRAMTGYLLLQHYGRVQAGQTVLVHGAAGGLGLVLAQWASTLGATVIGTVSSTAKAELAQTRGVRHVINYRQQDFVGAALALTAGQGVDLVLDGIGGDNLLRSIAATCSGGMVQSVGAVSGDGMTDAALPAAQARGVLLERPSILGFIRSTAQYRSAAVAAVQRLQQGLQIDIAERLPLAEAARAHRLLEEGAVQGALLLLP